MSLYQPESNSLPLVHWQIEGDAPQHVLSVLEVPEEPDSDVEAGDDNHRGVEDPVPTHESSWCPHLKQGKSVLISGHFDSVMNLATFFQI